MAPRLLIVDDHDGFRSFVSAMLATEGFSVMADVDTGEAALETLRTTRPDLVLLDVQLPGLDGFEVAERIAATPDPPAVVLTSSRQASDYGVRLTHAAARGFITKQSLSGAALTAMLAG